MWSVPSTAMSGLLYYNEHVYLLSENYTSGESFLLVQMYTTAGGGPVNGIAGPLAQDYDCHVPLAYNGTIIVLCGCQVFGFDADTLANVWNYTDSQAEGCLGTRPSISSNGTILFARTEHPGLDKDIVVAVDAMTGSRLYRVQLGHEVRGHYTVMANDGSILFPYHNYYPPSGVSSSIAVERYNVAEGKTEWKWHASFDGSTAANDAMPSPKLGGVFSSPHIGIAPDGATLIVTYTDQTSNMPHICAVDLQTGVQQFCMNATAPYYCVDAMLKCSIGEPVFETHSSDSGIHFFLGMQLNHGGSQKAKFTLHRSNFTRAPTRR